MPSDKLRRQITHEAARLMYTRQESEYYRAKMKAARRICRGWVKPKHLPSNREIRDEIQALVQLYEGDRRNENLREMRIEALRIMRALCEFRPRLIGSTLTGHVRRGSDIDIHVFAGSTAAVTGALDLEGVRYDVERKDVRKHGEARTYTHVHVDDRFPIEITVYPPRQAHVVSRSSITGKPIERANIAELEQLLGIEYPEMDVDAAVDAAEHKLDRFQVFEMLLLPLEQLKQSRRYHPEGDALYHCLQVFDHARDEAPYDEELLLAALLHDVGKAIDAKEHVAASLQALEGYISPRTAWLIEHHMEGAMLRDGRLGVRSRRRLEASEYFDDLMLLVDCDRAGRQPGVEAPELDEALAYLRELASSCGE